MFCKYCGAELESDAIFCTSCGKRIAGAADSPANAGGAQTGHEQGTWGGRQYSQFESATRPSANAPKEGKEGVNSLCIAGCVLTGLSFFIDYFGIIALAAFFVSVIGYRGAKKQRQEGAILAVIAMIISAVLFVVSFVAYIQYYIYGVAVFGMLNRFLNWLNAL